MSKAESIAKLQSLLGQTALVDENALQSEMDAIIEKIEKGEQLDTVQEELKSVKEELQNKTEETISLEKELTEVNSQLSIAEAKKVSPLPSVKHDGVEYLVKYGCNVNHEGKLYRFNQADIVANKKLDENGLTPVAILLAAGSKAVKPV